MKKYVKIQSSKNINVMGGLFSQNFTKLDSDIKDRLKVAPKWSDTVVMIQQGTFWYPSFICEWPTVKSLEKSGIITFGGYADEINDINCKEIEERVTIALKDIKKDDVEDKWLEDAVEGE